MTVERSSVYGKHLAKIVAEHDADETALRIVRSHVWEPFRKGQR